MNAWVWGFIAFFLTDGPCAGCWVLPNQFTAFSIFTTTKKRHESGAGHGDFI
jgi:hypothetical protein